VICYLEESEIKVNWTCGFHVEEKNIQRFVGEISFQRGRLENREEYWKTTLNTISGKSIVRMFDEIKWILFVFTSGLWCKHVTALCCYQRES
jgi:hypothetical protein